MIVLFSKTVKIFYLSIPARPPSPNQLFCSPMNIILTNYHFFIIYTSVWERMWARSLTQCPKTLYCPKMLYIKFQRCYISNFWVISLMLQYSYLCSSILSLRMPVKERISEQLLSNSATCHLLTSLMSPTMFILLIVQNLQSMLI